MLRNTLRLTRLHPPTRATATQGPFWVASSWEGSRRLDRRAEYSRSFSRRVRGHLDDPDEELNELKASEETRKFSKTPSAVEMEFFAQLGDGGDDDYDDEDPDGDSSADAEYKRKQVEIQRELDSRTGRGWTDPWHISEEQWMSLQTADDLPGWSSEFVSRISQERVKVYPDGVPTLAALASMSVPSEPCPHPGLGQTKEYAAYRKKYHYDYVSKQVEEIAKPIVDRIMKISTWEQKQDAVDEMFETVEEQLRNQEEILGLHPDFGTWVSTALEEYLAKVQSGDASKGSSNATDSVPVEPVFMDCFSSDEPDDIVPKILSPLKPHPRDGPGRMVEEWQLAANKKTKRILLRACTQKIADTLEKNDVSRILVHGRKGVGKVR